MSSAYLKGFSNYLNESYIRSETEYLLAEIVEAVEISHYNDTIEDLKSLLDEARHTNTELKKEVSSLASDKENLIKERDLTQLKALKVRNAFVADIGAVLNEGRSVMKLKGKIRSLEDKVSHMEQLEQDLEDTEKKLKAIEKAYYLTQNVKDDDSLKQVSLPILEDSLLLNVFSFLETEDVLSAAQINRRMFARVDNLFSIGSAIIQPDWLDYGGDKQPMPNTGVTDESVSIGDTLLTQQIAEVLARKLTAAELRVIVSMKEELDKQEQKIRKQTTEAEDLAAKIDNTERVRDFLIEKLKSAEMAIKTFMKDNSELKVQSAADKEVISFLDLHRLEIDSVNRDLLNKNEALRASVEVLTSLNAQTERQYGVEISELKDRLSGAEKEHKSQKKVLTKEIKTLRSLLASNTEELERHRSHLNNLRRSLDIVNHHDSSGSFKTHNQVPVKRQHVEKESHESHRSSKKSTNPFA